MSFLFSLLALSFFSSCNVIQAVGDGETLVNGKPPKDLHRDHINVPYDSLNDGLIAFYRFEETSGFVTNDRQGGARNLTSPKDLANSVSTSGYNGNGIDCGLPMNGSYFSNTAFSYNTSASDNFTIGFWMRRDGPGVRNYFEFTDSSTGSSIYMGQNGSNQLHLKILGSPFSFSYATSSNWEHIVIRYLPNQGKVELFTNGVLQETMALSAVPLTLDHLYICDGISSPVVANLSMLGAMDSFGIWNRALHVDEIADLYNGNNTID